MANPTCPRGHELGTEPGCPEPRCCVRRMESAHGHERRVEIASAAVEPLQAQVRALEAERDQMRKYALDVGAAMLEEVGPGSTTLSISEAASRLLREMIEGHEQESFVAHDITAFVENEDGSDEYVAYDLILQRVDGEKFTDNLGRCTQENAELREALAAKDAELARVREWAEHFAQLAYDASGNPIDGWEEVCEAWDEGRLDYLSPNPEAPTDDE